VLLAKTGLNKRNGGSCKKIIGEEKKRFIFPFVFSFFRRFAKFIVLQNLFSTVLCTTGRVEQKHEIHLKILNENNNYYKNYKIFINQAMGSWLQKKTGNENFPNVNLVLSICQLIVCLTIPVK
jgi:hypothetical protein